MFKDSNPSIFSHQTEAIMFICGRQEEPAILISMLLLQTHALRLYKFALTRFLLNS